MENNQISSGSGKLNVGLLVWSIVNILFFGKILGGIALANTFLAKTAPDSIEESKAIRRANAFNAATTIAGLIVYLGAVILGLGVYGYMF